MPVPYTFQLSTSPIPLSQLDANFTYFTTAISVSGTDITVAGTTTTANAIVNANSATNALRITQTGAGNALLVEDSANPDSSPFVIDQNGVVGIGTTTPQSTFSLTSGIGIQSTTAFSPQVTQRNKTNDSSASYFISQKDRAGAIVQSGDAIGNIVFQAYDGAAYLNAAYILGQVDGTPGTNDMPGRLVFSTTADGASSPTERMRISSAGEVGIGAAPTSKLDVVSTGQNIISSRSTGGYAAVLRDASTGQIAYDFYKINGTEAARVSVNSSNNYSIGNGSSATERLRIASTGTISLGAAPGAESLRVAPIASAVNYVQATGGITGSAVTLSAQGSDTNVGISVSGKGTGYPNLNTQTAVGAIVADAQITAQITASAGGNIDILRAKLYRHTAGSDWTGVGYRFGQVVDVTEMSYIEFNPVGQSQGLAVQVAGASAAFQVKTNGGEQFRVSNTASAVNYMQVSGNATTGAPILSAQGSDTNVNILLLSKGTGGHVLSTGTTPNIQFVVANTASAVNYMQVSGGATGSAATLSAQGSDTNIDLALTPKGTGNVRFGTLTANADAPITGYILIKDSAGTTRKLAVIA